jgi:thioredoxin-related protein
MTAISAPRSWRLEASVDFAALVAPDPAGAQESQPRSGQNAPPAPAFNEQADAHADLATALANAQRDNRRVLLMFGANWCGWSRKLDTLLRQHRDIARTLLCEYELVNVDIGRRDKNMDIANDYGADVANSGIPYLTVLAADGNVLTNQETGALEVDDAHDPARVQAFLKKWQAEPLDAGKVFEQARAQAAKQHKRLFLHFGVPTCKWCRRLDDFLRRKDIAEIVACDFVPVKIDLRRMTGADEVAKRFRKTDSGSPWFAIVDGKDHVLATSDGPRGNVGFPVEPHEIAHFIDVLKKTAPRMTVAEIGKIEQTLKDNATHVKATLQQARDKANGRKQP